MDHDSFASSWPHHACSRQQSRLLRVEDGSGNVALGEVEELLVIAGNVQSTLGIAQHSLLVSGGKLLPSSIGEGGGDQLRQQQRRDEEPESGPNRPRVGRRLEEENEPIFLNGTN